MKTKILRFHQKIWFGIGIGVLILLFGFFLNQPQFFQGSIRRSAEDTFQSFCRSLWGDFDSNNDTCQYVDTTYNDIEALEERHRAFANVCARYGNIGSVWNEDAFECAWWPRYPAFVSEGHLMSQLSDFERVCTRVYSLEWHQEDFTCELEGVRYKTPNELEPIVRFRDYCKQKQGDGAVWHSEDRTCEYQNISYDNFTSLHNVFESGPLQELCSQIVNTEWIPAAARGMANHCMWGPPTGRYFTKSELETEIQRLQQRCDRTVGALWDDAEKKCLFEGQNYYNASSLAQATEVGPFKMLCEKTEGAVWHAEMSVCDYDGMTYGGISVLQQIIDLKKTYTICDQIKNAIWHNRHGCEWGGHTVTSPVNLLDNIRRIKDACDQAEGASWNDDEKKCEFEGKSYYNENLLKDDAEPVSLRALCSQGDGNFIEGDTRCELFEQQFDLHGHLGLNELRFVVNHLDFISYCRSLNIGEWVFGNIEAMSCTINGTLRFDQLSELKNYIADLQQEEPGAVAEPAEEEEEEVREAAAIEGNEGAPDEVAADQKDLAQAGAEEVAVREDAVVPAAPAPQPVPAPAPSGGGGGGGGFAVPVVTPPSVAVSVTATAKKVEESPQIKGLTEEIETLKKELKVTKSAKKKKSITLKIKSLEKKLKKEKEKLGKKKGKKKAAQKKVSKKKKKTTKKKKSALRGALGEGGESSDDLQEWTPALASIVVFLIIAGIYMVVRKKRKKLDR